MNKLKNKQQLIYRWREFINDIGKDTLFNSIIIKPCTKAPHLFENSSQLTYGFPSHKVITKKAFENSKLAQYSLPFLKHISLALKNIPHIISIRDIDREIISSSETLKTSNIKKISNCLRTNCCLEDIYTAD
ncbi:hypothetical protein [Clostridium sp.]|jgi:hypothetical protein|uniref:hypothetical protein n=1 Tax=Clostridium sp. TaxID=1506 RepID=UPI002FDD5985